MQDGGCAPAEVMTRAGERPLAGSRVKQFGTRQEVAVAKAAGGKNFPVAQEDRDSCLAWNLHPTAHFPACGDRIVDFRVGGKIRRTTEASGNKHLAVGERNSHVTRA